MMRENRKFSLNTRHDSQNYLQIHDCGSMRQLTIKVKKLGFLLNPSLSVVRLPGMNDDISGRNLLHLGGSVKPHLQEVLLIQEIVPLSALRKGVRYEKYIQTLAISYRLKPTPFLWIRQPMISGSNAFLLVFTHSVKETSSNDKKRLTDRLSHLRKEF